jgi:hypothetical protein
MFKTINELIPLYLRELFESLSTGYTLRNPKQIIFVQNRERTMVNEFLVTMGQCCGI